MHLPIEMVTVTACEVPTDQVESDGTLEWDRTVVVLVEVQAQGMAGFGYTYADTATATLVRDTLAPLLHGQDAFAIRALWERQRAAVRNLGRHGVAAMAISAVDVALWDLKARALGLPLADLLGRVRDSIDVYGSGGFCSYRGERLERQLGDWAAAGLHAVKMKVGREPRADAGRVRLAREAIGDAGLFVDANGAYSRKQALALAHTFASCGVSWFEEPVSSDDLDGLRLLRDRAPPGMDIAAGEYGYDGDDFRRMLVAGAVDVLQIDATRCGGYTGALQAAALAETHHLPLSCHCAPALHLPLACALPGMRHIEYFHDHVRIEHLLLSGVPKVDQGGLALDLERPGLGLAPKRAAIARHRIA